MTAEELVAKYGDMVYNLAFRLTGNASDAEDVAQDALIRAVKGLESFRGEADPGTWVYRITVNTWKNRVRSEKRRFFWKMISLESAPPGDDDEERVPQVPSQEPPLDRTVETDESRAAVEAALAVLEPEDRAILVLRDLDDRSYEEIAEVLSLALGTVKSRLFRAREALREKLMPFAEGKKI